MSTPDDPLTLALWRQQVNDLYAAVRSAPPGEGAAACARFRQARDDLFRHHPDSPLPPPRRATFPGLRYYPYDPAWRVRGLVNGDISRRGHAVALPGGGVVEFTRVAVVRFRCPAGDASLHLYWVEGYGGGLFLPFRDGTCGRETYHAGRYLIDTAKGANLGLGNAEIVLDFNYAYNPSCAYGDRWVCPLAPPENTLRFEVPVGEKMPATGGDGPR